MFMLLSAFVFVGCGDDDNASVHLKNASSTGCKQESVPGDTDRSKITDIFGEEYVEYTSKSDGYLYVRHVNAIFNCCSEKIKVTSSESGGIITVSEADTDISCNCVCPFDVSYEIGPLEKGRTYTLNILNNGSAHVDFTFTYPSDGKVVIKR